MNEFIAWNNKTKKFTDWSTIRKFRNFEKLLSLNHVDLMQYIGKTDINDKKIYAESSIVEFLFNDGTVYTRGYFVFNKKFLSYFVYDLEDKKHYKFNNFISNYIKIIDTIQENKLGLIKEN